ncbi:hypothetical protein [Hymenobacter sp. 102]|uniref:hypothetical protein n=1 Tax=Hymenobacter sp. 102 TaxID=3403152 RepID=UPI003CF96EFB
MSILKTKGITVYYIDFSLPKNRTMKIKTIAHNKREWVKQLNLHQRINFKSAYPLNCGKLFEQLHLLNLWFSEQPYALIV